jgi:threonine/homoserine/homoserine lactone efflux protein
MNALIAFLVAFIFSFIGSIPPGTLNLSIIQLGLEHRINVAWRFAIACTIIEIPYAWIAIEFENLIFDSPVVTDYFQLITGAVMIVLGTLNLIMANKPSQLYQRFSDSGFRRGLILGILNPMALPFWIAMTAYLESNEWITLSTTIDKFSYLMGVWLGAFVLLMILAFTAKKVVSQFQGNTLLKKIPGITLLLLGLYAIGDYFI